MATDRQIAANRRNGSLSRGPKTSAGKARSSRNALKHGLSIPVNRDKTLRRQIEVLARILAQWKPGIYLGKRGPRPKRSSSCTRSSRIGGSSYARRDYCRVEWWTGTRHCADPRPPRVAEPRTLRASGILQTKASPTGSLNRHGLRESRERRLAPFWRISEIKLNAALALIEAAAPKDEIEGALAVQMACTHTVAMMLLAKMEAHFAPERRVAASGRLRLVC